MFNFAWSELGMIAVVALILIGPKDMPVAIRTVTELIRKARRMAGEFQTHVDDLVREANLTEVRDQISELRNYDIRGEIERQIDPDGSLTATLNEKLIEHDTPVAEYSPQMIDQPPEVDEVPTPAYAAADGADPPAFIPPGVSLPELAPAFIPPGIRRF